MEVQKLECKTITRDTEDSKGQSEKESLPLLGTNLINRGRGVSNREKREQPEFNFNGPLLGTF